MRSRHALLAVAVPCALLLTGPSAAVAHHAAVARVSTGSWPHPEGPVDETRPPPPPAAVMAAADEQRPWPVVGSELALTDSSRPASLRQTDADTNRRTLRIVVRHPATRSNPLPVVIFVHGFASEPETYEPLLASWAAAGYLVIAPELPDAASDLPGAPTRDIAEQARDVSFVLDAVIAGRAGPVDPSRISVIGHSDGGSVVATLALNSALRDPRFRAYAVLSGAIPEQVTVGEWDSGSDVAPMLVAVGDLDEYGDLPAAQSVFARAGHPSAIVHVADGDHLRMYIDPSPEGDALRALIVDFLDRATASSPTATTLDDLGSGTSFAVTTH